VHAHALLRVLIVRRLLSSISRDHFKGDHHRLRLNCKYRHASHYPTQIAEVATQQMFQEILRLIVELWRSHDRAGVRRLIVMLSRAIQGRRASK